MANPFVEDVLEEAGWTPETASEDEALARADWERQKPTTLIDRWGSILGRFVDSDSPAGRGLTNLLDNPLGRSVIGVGEGVGRAALDAGKMFVDLASSPVATDEWELFGQTMTGGATDALQQHGGNALMNLAGPDMGLGLFFGELPDPVRDNGRAFLEKYGQWMDRGFTATVGDAVASQMIALNAFERFLRGDLSSLDETFEYISEVQSQRFGHEVDFWEHVQRSVPGGTAARVAFGDETVEDLESGLLDPENRTRAEGMSPGQLTYMSVFNLGEVNLTDEVALMQYQTTGQFGVGSAIMDGAMRLLLDPDIIAGKALKTRYAGTIARRVDPARMDELMETPKIQRFLEDAEALPIDEFVDKTALKGQDAGYEIAHLLKQADTTEQRAMLLRHFMGDSQAAHDLSLFREDLLAQTRKLTNPQSAPISVVDEVDAGSRGIAVDQARTERLNDWENFQWIRGEADEIPAVMARVDRLQDLHQTFTRENQVVSRGALAMLPGGNKLDERANLSMRQLGYHVQHSPIFQRGPLNYPVQVAGGLLEKAPHRFLRLEHSDSAEQVRRQLKRSDIDADRQNALLQRYTEAGTGTERLAAYHNIEDEAVKSIIEKAGASEEGVRNILERAAEVRNRTSGYLRDSDNHRIHRYDGGNRDMLEVMSENGELIITPMPLSVSQTADIAPMVDLDFIRKATKTFSSKAMQSKALWALDSTADTFTNAWKTGALLRPAWMTRVLLLDEHLRVLAKMGTFEHKMPLKTRAGDWSDSARDYFNDFTNIGALGRWSERFGELPIGPGKAQGSKFEAAARSLTDPVTGEVKYDWLRMKDLRVPGIGRHEPTQMAPFKVKGTDVEVPPIWTQGDKSEVYERLLSSKASFDSLLGREEQRILGNLRSSGRWAHLDSGDVGYFEEWSRRLNMQVGQDALTSRILKAHLDEGGDMSGVRQWLKESEEGLEYQGRMPWRKDLDEWVDSLEDQALDYTRGDPELMRRALDGAVDAAELKALKGELPTINGEVLEQLQGTHTVIKGIKDFIDNSMTRLGTFSSDRLMRQKFARSLYREDMHTRVQSMLASKKSRGLAEEITQKELDRMTELSRQYVVKETQNLLYNFADTNRLTEMLRHVSPFFGAWQEAMVKWLQLGVERPDFLARAFKVWNSPSRVKDMESEDENGNTYITLPMPEIAKKIPFFQEFFEDQGNLKIQKQHLNLVFEGPGFGTFVTIPTSKIVEGRPELEEAVEFILPYGPRPAIDELMPGLARRLTSRVRQEDDRSYRNAMMRFWHIETIKAEQGDRPDLPTFEEIKDRTDSYFMLRTVAGSFLPANPQWPSPYEPYIETLQQLRDEDPMTADERFLSQFGDEFFALTESVTQTMNGMPPTVEAWHSYENDPKIRSMVDEYPELGNLIIGAEGGEFSRSVYNAQLATESTPGSGQMMREPKSYQEWEEGHRRRLGWVKYQQEMMVVDTLQAEAGLPNLQVAAAEPLAEYKRQKIEELREEYPEWAADYDRQDRGKPARRMEVFRAMTSDEDFLGRPEIQGLDVYLTTRDMVVNILKERHAAGGAGTMEAAANQDVAEVWDMLTALIRERNPAFSDVYYRYLDRDTLSYSDEVGQ